LLFSKTTGFRHGQAIEASIPIFESLAEKNQWSLYSTEDAGIINSEELTQFDVVIWNNSTGRCLTDDQRTLLEDYIKSGGSFLGIHGSGDHSHHWDWYIDHLIGAEFSHHPIKNQIQNTVVKWNEDLDSTLTAGLSNNWEHEDEWYVFYGSPEENGFTILYEIDGTSIDSNGNLPLLESDKDFGMGKNHPVAWYKNIEEGKAFYTSMGHMGSAFQNDNFVSLLENALNWSIMD
jgi:type 1 glutamine amidotransferase